MTNKKRFVVIGSIFIIIIIVAISVILYAQQNSAIAEDYNEKYSHLPKYDIEQYFVMNFSNLERAVDYYPYVFIAKVNKVIGTEYRNPIEKELTADGSETKTIYEPYTIYDISVVENLKGEIIKNTNITIEQVGGVSQDNDYVIFPSNMEFLKENCYYILLPYATPETDELRLESAYNIIELGELTNKATIKKIREISKIQELDTIENLIKEKSNNDVINKVITYKHACLTPVNMEEYKQMAEKNGIKDYETFYFKKNISKYDVNYSK